MAGLLLQKGQQLLQNPSLFFAFDLLCHSSTQSKGCSLARGLGFTLPSTLCQPASGAGWQASSTLREALGLGGAGARAGFRFHLTQYPDPGPAPGPGLGLDLHKVPVPAPGLCPTNQALPTR